MKRLVAKGLAIIPLLLAVAAWAGSGSATAAVSTTAVIRTDLGPPDCFYGIGRYKIDLGTPQPVGVQGPFGPGQTRPTGGVSAQGQTDIVNNTNCSHPKVQYSLQRKVCGFWGCHWRDETKLNPIALPVNGSVQREVSTTCHGTHHYRMFARLTWVEMTFEDQGGRWSPMLVTNTKTFNSPSTQITCLDTQH